MKYDISGISAPELLTALYRYAAKSPTTADVSGKTIRITRATASEAIRKAAEAVQRKSAPGEFEFSIRTLQNVPIGITFTAIINDGEIKITHIRDSGWNLTHSGSGSLHISTLEKLVQENCKTKMHARFSHEDSVNPSSYLGQLQRKLSTINGEPKKGEPVAIQELMAALEEGEAGASPELLLYKKIFNQGILPDLLGPICKKAGFKNFIDFIQEIATDNGIQSSSAFARLTTPDPTYPLYPFFKVIEQYAEGVKARTKETEETEDEKDTSSFTSIAVTTVFFQAISLSKDEELKAINALTDVLSGNLHFSREDLENCKKTGLRYLLKPNLTQLGYVDLESFIDKIIQDTSSQLFKEIDARLPGETGFFAKLGF
jgi:hypothetical protein